MRPTPKHLSVLMLTDALHEDAPGGSRRVAKELAEGLVAQGHRVSILVPRWRGDEPTCDDAHGVCIRRYGDGRKGFRALPQLLAQGWGALNELRQEGNAPFDVLHVHFAYSHLPALLPATAPLARATIRSFYGPWAAEGLAEVGPRRPGDVEAAFRTRVLFQGRDSIERQSLAHSDHVIALSDYSIGQLTRSYDIPRPAITLVPGGVDHRYFVPTTMSKADVRQRLGLPTASPMILTVRRLAARMGLDNLIAAMPHVMRTLPAPPHLVIVGQGRFRVQLEAQTAAMGLEDSIHFAGFVPDAELPLYFQAADLFVLPTRSLEGFGLITLEAFASGLPVVGTPVGATPELLAQVDRRLILDSVGPEAIASGIVRYFTEVWAGVDPSPLRDLVMARYTWKHVVSATEQVYRQALDRVSHEDKVAKGGPHVSHA